MILSYHPCYAGDENRLCAGRDPDDRDAARMKQADAVILPQGCYPALFEMAVRNCRHVFPDYTCRFRHPGKIGQAKLFRKSGVLHPATLYFESVEEYADEYAAYRSRKAAFPPFGYPFVFKFPFSGEGDQVWRIDDPETLESLLQAAGRFERTGQKGFLLQQYIETGGRSLRVVVMNTTCISYWRKHPDPARFCAQAAQGAAIDYDSDPALQVTARNAVMEFCKKTGINLAAFDMLFSVGDPCRKPYFLEINYYFGRRGMGGSAAFYEMLNREIVNWLSQRGLEHNILCGEKNDKGKTGSLPAD